jgi:hypothetical protein
MESKFDWNDSDAVVLKTTRGIAVYLNTDGDLVVRQDGREDDYDQCVVVPRDRATSVIEAMCDAIGVGRAKP